MGVGGWVGGRRKRIRRREKRRKPHTANGADVRGDPFTIGTRSG